jgi:hypothetical protein
LAIVVVLAFVLAVPVANACRVRRPATLSLAGVPAKCSDEAFKVSASARTNRPIVRIELELDGRTIARGADDKLTGRVACERLTAGRHELRVEAENSIGKVSEQKQAFRVVPQGIRVN